MANSMYHRGPDDSGFYENQYAALGVRRLSIIDLETGHQPMCNEDSSVWLVFNGEIYNFKDLRAGLEGRGHRFRSQSDTEVVVHLYEEEGIECVNHLEGMFAFCILDEAKRQLFLARDRFGEKPLYFFSTSKEFVFASELKAIVLHPSFKRKLDHVSLSKYLFYGYVPAPRTIYRNVHKLPPATSLSVASDGTIGQNAYWGPSWSAKCADNLNNLCDTIWKQLVYSVERRLTSDVSLGVLLSGGIDSALVTYAASQALPEQDILAFSLGFEDERYDEVHFASIVAEEAGVTHKVKYVSESDYFNLTDDALSIIDEPMADSSLVPTYALCKYARDYVKVALGGDGGDELFAGYPKYLAHKLVHLFPDSNELTNKIAGVLASASDSVNQFRVSSFFEGLKYPPEVRNQVWIAQFLPHEVARISSQDREPSLLLSDVYSRVGYFNGSDIFDKMLHLDTTLNLPELYLVKVDRASMACSLEVRSPFLDTSLATLAMSLPFHTKVNGFTTKYVLRQLARRYFPKSIYDRRKKGFGFPMAKNVKGQVLELLSNDVTNLDVSAAREIVSRKNCNPAKVWNLYVLLKWQKRWLTS